MRDKVSGFLGSATGDPDSVSFKHLKILKGITGHSKETTELEISSLSASFTL